MTFAFERYLTPAQLLAQYQQALAQWPFIPEIEKAHGLPPMLLFAVGSRESNLTNEKGDWSQRPGDPAPCYHGFGVWQKDIGNGGNDAYLADVRQQAEDAAAHLAGSEAQFGSWQAAANAYNSGQPYDQWTTGKDYGSDVMSRMTWLQTNAPPAPQEDDMPKAFICEDPATGGTWAVLTDDGEVDTADGAPYLGGQNSHPDWHSMDPAHPIVGIAPWKDAQGQWGYKIGEYDPSPPPGQGRVRFYRFDRAGSQRTPAPTQAPSA